MSIIARCDCGKQYKLPDDLAGKRVRCKVCREPVLVPNAAPGKLAKPRRQDPLADLDALKALEESGTVHETAPVKTSWWPTAPVATVAPVEAEWTPVDDKVAPVVVRPKLLKMRGRQGGPAVRPVQYVGDAYAAVPFEDAMDSYLPLLSIGTMVLAMLAPIVLITYFMANPPDGREVSWSRYPDVLRAYAKLVGILLGYYVVLPSLLLLGGITVASKIRRFPLPGSVFLRCVTVVCAPVAIAVGSMGVELARRGVPAMPSWLGPALLPMWGLVFWMMFRLRAVHFVVTFGCALVSCIGIPWLLMIVFASAFNMNVAPRVLGMKGGSNPAVAAGNAPAAAQGESWVMAGRVLARQRLIELHRAILAYTNLYGGKFPAGYDDLSRLPGFDPTLTTSPTDQRPFAYYYFPGLARGIAKEYVLLGTPIGDGLMVIFVDGHVEEISHSVWPMIRSRNQGLEHTFRSNALIARTGPNGTNPPATAPPPLVVDPSVPKPAMLATFKKIDSAIHDYATAHNGRFPVSLKDLVTAGKLDEGDISSPAGFSYTYGFHPRLRFPLPADLMLVYDAESSETRRTVLFGDGRVIAVETSTWGDVMQASAKARLELAPKK